MWLSRDGCDMARIEYEITSVPFEIMARSSEQWQKTSFLGAAKKKNCGLCFFSYPPRNRGSIRSTAAGRIVPCPIYP